MAIELDFSRPYALLTLNRPDAHNALQFSMIDALARALDDVAASAARALIVTGAGPKAFCAGADIKELMDRGLMDQRRGAQRGQRTFAKLAALPIPSVAVLHGYAFGGGLELAMACTFRIATSHARMGLPEIKLGLIPGYGGTQRLSRLIGEARAIELVMSGRTVDATEAERWGLVNRIVPDGDPVELGKAFMAEFVGYSRCASQFAREAVARGVATTLDEGLAIEADLSTLAYQTADAAEGMRAFIEKRTPEFKDA
ncbi:enoyl-CoA hydratase/isomerase family protein [Burkholderia multivorans]|uniref:enoyl-CoA hydratase/isomerase family protein n=1 Tax=Burkholderia multivorans TaxID=87883 RepID=UPI0020187B5C|nr:enoyl-CoA hydratase-related protein [Burkholderia multivorans]MCL4653590.1 enoyl-CoA hydratase-related protein [Burkholderia multivorans]MCL4659102.1 enoyl-CoA hydratase-related protein [Burkholderia multivorans]MCO1428092.1 enoyl-CoA hydratase-related protein [Burkholderia multivorans]UQN56545.1 enoyl-CoA hydratase-related protein [Burkholderia multivorans]UQN79775.1 enoyl-CoA hydratase-related protein [Burkholderia multivorans]